MQITSSDFQNMEPLPERFGRDIENINPSLTFSEIPLEAQSLLLIVDDPDAPSGTFTHWILYNMSPATLQIVEGELPISGIQGFSDYGEDSYGGPQPPSGTHRYVFKLVALDKMLEFEEGVKVDRAAIDQAIRDHVVEEAQIIGTYSANR
jgi:Raf kinase inhibitor-like YbhB/YbcL family protein